MKIFIKSRVLLSTILIFLILGFAKMAVAEDLILKDLNGRVVNLSDYKGAPVILFFWTTWCHFCRDEIKALNQKYNQLKKEGITLFAINVGEPEYKVQKFFKDYALNFKVLLDEFGLAADKYGIVGVPTYILLDKTRKVISSENRLPEDYKGLLLSQIKGK